MPKKRSDITQFNKWFKEQYPAWSQAPHGKDLIKLQDMANAGELASQEIRHINIANIAREAAMHGFVSGFEAGRKTVFVPFQMRLLRERTRDGFVN